MNVTKILSGPLLSCLDRLSIMKKISYPFHRKVIWPADGRLLDFGPAMGGYGYDAMAMGRGGQGKVQNEDL